MVEHTDKIVDANAVLEHFISESQLVMCIINGWDPRIVKSCESKGKECSAAQLRVVVMKSMNYVKPKEEYDK